ncbi:hypothetical protein PIB30_115922, partial [Stylosanthes scabra]|nr:hypothetical protein [Stylosanthes scabra]
AYKRESVNDVGHDRPAGDDLVLLQTLHYPPAALGLHQMRTDARRHCTCRCARSHIRPTVRLLVGDHSNAIQELC